MGLDVSERALGAGTGTGTDLGGLAWESQLGEAGRCYAALETETVIDSIN
jgi:hypothetical protein